MDLSQLWFTCWQQVALSPSIELKLLINNGLLSGNGRDDTRDPRQSAGR
jgi:hypothetical protein